MTGGWIARRTLPTRGNYRDHNGNYGHEQIRIIVLEVTLTLPKVCVPSSPHDNPWNWHHNVRRRQYMYFVPAYRKAWFYESEKVDADLIFRNKDSVTATKLVERHHDAANSVHTSSIMSPIFESNLRPWLLWRCHVRTKQILKWFKLERSVTCHY